MVFDQKNSLQGYKTVTVFLLYMIYYKTLDLAEIYNKIL